MTAPQPDSQQPPRRPAPRNTRVVVFLCVLLLAMVGLTSASVPLYRLFCQVTGYGGTTQVAETLPDQVSDRIIAVRFNADTDPHLPWTFQPVQKEVRVHVGENGLAYFRARNDSKKAITGQAVFNVSPPKVGLYFDKIQCFCFDEQRLEPGQEVDMAVSFFIDPDIEKDSNLDDITSLTLSYTFYRAADDQDDEAGASKGSTATPQQSSALPRMQADERTGTLQ